MSGSEFTFHLVTPSNSALLDRVDEDVFDDRIQPKLLKAFLSNPANLLVVAVAEGKVIGMASGMAYVHPDKPLQLFINEAGVATRFQRQGVGTELMKALLRHGETLGCQEAWVATEVSNTAARALYKSVGGKEADERAVVYSYSLAVDQANAAPNQTTPRTP